MDRVFISYRRTDTIGTVHRLKDALVHYLGPGRVFLDTADLDYGAPFRPAVREAIDRSTVTFVVIGPRWLESSGSNGPRLFEPDDPVRIEILTAGTVGCRVIPILVDRYEMPSRQSVPEDLAFLTELNAIHLSNARFDEDIVRILAVLKKPPLWVAMGPRRRWSTKALASGLLLVGHFAEVSVGRSPAGPLWSSLSALDETVFFLVQFATPIVALFALRDTTRFGLRGPVLAFLVFVASYFMLFAIFVLTGTYPLAVVPLLAIPFVLWRKRLEWSLAWWQRRRWR